jgi:hypothetical protein
VEKYLTHVESYQGFLMAPSKVHWGNQNGVVTVRFSSRVWRYDLPKIAKKRPIMLEKVLTKQKKLTFSSSKMYQNEILQRDLKKSFKCLGSPKARISRDIIVPEN